MHLECSYNLRLMSIWDFDKWSVRTETLHRKNERQPLMWTSRCFLFILYCRLSSDPLIYSLHTGILAVQSISLRLKHWFVRQVHCLCRALTLWTRMPACREKRLLSKCRVRFLFQWEKIKMKTLVPTSPTAQNEGCTI